MTSTTRSLLFGLPGNERMTEQLARRVGGDVGLLSIRSYPDDETCLRIETDPKDRDVVLVCTLGKPNEKVVPLLFVAGAARALGARQVGVVAPYLPYIRQDAEFPGEAAMAHTFADMIESEAEWVLTVDPRLHAPTRLTEIYRIPVTALDVADEIGRWITHHVTDPIIIGPDEDSRQWAICVAAAADAPFVVFRKERRTDAYVRVVVPEIPDHDGRTPVIIDDVISTGQTMIAALVQTAARLPAARRAVCVGVHALFSNRSLNAMLDAGAERVVTTNTIPNLTNAIDVTRPLARALRRQLAQPLDAGPASAAASIS